MKKIKLSFGILLLLMVTISCAIEDGIDEDLTFLNSAVSNNVDAFFEISNDNSGNVKITPTGQGVTSFEINYGHGTADEAFDVVYPGSSTTHAYPEGNYSVSVIASDIAGNKTTTEYPLNVTYRAPENLTMNTTVNVFNVKVSASALYAQSFLVYFGDVENEVGTPLAIGATTPDHTYASGGAYTIKVVALSGGAATSEVTKTIIIFDPLALPYTCELASQNYLAGGTFGGVNYSIVDNPFSTGLNTSSKVVKFEKPIGAAEWAGTWKPLDVPIDLSTGTKIRMLVYATEVGKNVGLELQASTNGAPNTVIFVATTVADQWEELIFDTTTNPNIPSGATYKQFNINYNRPNAGEGEIIYIDNIRVTN
ncbi:MAG: PKD domain-containing protein [Flavobacteriaceae bacterium]|nr:PKD domain-containing protein [Flavobacteriaceae bacterium]